MTGIVACLPQCFAVTQNFYSSLLDTRFPSIKVKYIFTSPCSVESTGLLGKLYNLAAELERAGISNRNLNNSKQLGSAFYTFSTPSSVKHTGLPIITETQNVQLRGKMGDGDKTGQSEGLLKNCF